MPGTILIGGLATGALVLVCTSAEAGPVRLQSVLRTGRLRRSGALTASPHARPASVDGRSPPTDSVRGRRVAAIVVALAVLSMVSGGLGVVLAVTLGALSYRVLSRVESRAVVAERERMARDLPIAIHLVATAIAAGAPPIRALEVGGVGVGGPVGGRLRRIAASANLGGDLAGACRALPPESPLAPLARTIARALESGSPLAGALHRLATDLRARRRAELDRQARSVGVRAAAPLGLCFLPAFLLIGVVPVVVGLTTDLLGRVL